MNTEKEIHSLHAETLAFGTLITYVLHRIAQSDSKLATAIASGFDDAASFVENAAIRAGKAASPDHVVKALRIIEDLRAPTLGNRTNPQHGI
jgi:glycerol dehydrogenase-like iron-containing ADH family enzyme